MKDETFTKNTQSENIPDREKKHNQDKVFNQYIYGMKPLTTYYIQNIDKTCMDCYYFKRINEFIIFVRTR